MERNSIKLVTKLISSYKSPSNIALVKYWGKKNTGTQLPANASISFTLSDLCATTTVEAMPCDEVLKEPSFMFQLNDLPKASFEPKIKAFLKRIWDNYSLLKTHRLFIRSSNNFPHGAGIASSAAGFSALALCMVDLQRQFSGTPLIDPKREASRISRLGSGSACRSMFGEPGVWGKTKHIEEACDEYAVPMAGMHESFKSWKDIVLIVDASEKSVSSTEGHQQLDNNIYAESRYLSAKKSMDLILDALKKHNLPSFIHTVESEALQLHAMMMVSPMHYILMEPNTLAIIQKIWTFRKETHLPLCFTLDAGANVHLLYDSREEDKIINFVENELLPLCSQKQYFCSNLGGNPIKLSTIEK